MNKVETIKLLTIISAAYPSFEVTEERIALWHEMLEEADYGLAIEELKDRIMKEKFPPAISDIAEVIRREKERRRFEYEQHMALHGTAEPLKVLGD